MYILVRKSPHGRGRTEEGEGLLFHAAPLFNFFYVVSMEALTQFTNWLTFTFSLREEEEGNLPRKKGHST